MNFENTLEFARTADSADSLKDFRKRFLFPQHNGEDCIYFTGNSLGLQPASAREAILNELDDWAEFGVEGHFHARNPWYSYHELLMEPTARLMGAKTNEVVHMNGLTTNLHLLMVSFFRPEGKRTKILCEAKAFPSDHYVLESQLKHHGLNVADNLIALEPRAGEHCLRTEDVQEAIIKAGETLALVMIGGVNYYTGQVFDIKAITATAHQVGAIAGWDLAHAAGNIPLQLHEWNVDFAAWCSYKYLNSGPGSVSGIFVHQKHGLDPATPRFAGWWGYDKKRRFEMEPGFVPIPGAEGWQLSNAPVFSMAVHKASLQIFEEAGIERLREKSLKLTAYLEFIIKSVSNQSASFEIITPSAPNERGCQLSILAHGSGKSLFDSLTKQGVIADWREPNVIRVAPVPLYNSFEDVFRFGEALKKAVASQQIAYKAVN
jgi:kynureninase